MLNLRFDLCVSSSLRLWRMFRIMYYPDCCFDSSIACIDDWLSIYIWHLLYCAEIAPAICIPR